MNLGQTLQAKRTTSNTMYAVEELREGQTDEAIARSLRTGNRVLVRESEADGRYYRLVRDNGKSGSSLFDSLDPYGPRYAMWWPEHAARSRARR